MLKRVVVNETLELRLPRRAHDEEVVSFARLTLKLEMIGHNRVVPCSCRARAIALTTGDRSARGYVGGQPAGSGMHPALPALAQHMCCPLREPAVHDIEQRLTP